MDAKTLCLGVLTLGEASGYEIRKQFEEGPFAYFHNVSFGSIYPALAKLSDEEMVTYREEVQDGKPVKKIYAITEAGREAFRRALDKTPGEDQFRSETIYMLFFAEFLEGWKLEKVYDDYIALHRSYIEEMESESCSGDCLEGPPGRRLVHGIGLALYRALVDHMESEREAFMREIEKDNNP